MFKNMPVFILISVFSLSLYAQIDDYSTEEVQTDAVETDAVQTDDFQVVRAILEANQKSNWKIDDIATITDGRITALNLNNKDFGKEGITQLLPDIGQLSELTSLSINDNDLGAVPAALFNLTKLTRLEIRNNALMVLPAGIANLSNLEVLDLRNNQLRELPAKIGSLKKLRILQLWGNNFAKLPPEIGRLSSLRELYLKGNRLTNLPLSITKLKLEYLDVLDNKLCNLTGPIDKWLKKFDNKYVILQKCVGSKRFH